MTMGLILVSHVVTNVQHVQELQQDVLPALVERRVQVLQHVTV